jgi:hypothetical protein
MPAIPPDQSGSNYKNTYTTFIAEFQVMRRGSSMPYTVMFKPTNPDYRILKRAGYARDPSEYPVVSMSGFKSRAEAQQYIDGEWSPGQGKSRESYFIVEGPILTDDPGRIWRS